jgi:hypothetical protein
MMVKFLFDFSALVELEELGRNLVSMGVMVVTYYMAIKQVTLHFEKKIAPLLNGVHCSMGKMNLVMVIFYYTWICVSIRDPIAKLVQFLYS